MQVSLFSRFKMPREDIAGHTRKLWKHTVIYLSRFFCPRHIFDLDCRCGGLLSSREMVNQFNDEEVEYRESASHRDC